MESKYDEQFQVVFQAIQQLLDKDQQPGKKIGFLKEDQTEYETEHPPGIMSTHFYNIHARDYFIQTRQINPSSFLLPFAKRLTPESKVLDIGCGSGRDMLWLKERGFHCTGLERSPELAAMARQHTGLTVIEADLELYDLSRMKMDGLLLIGALVHLPHELFSPVLSNILKALKPGGHALVTMKQGQGRQELEDGRVFYLWEKEYLFSMLKNRLDLH